MKRNRHGRDYGTQRERDEALAGYNALYGGAVRAAREGRAVPKSDYPELAKVIDAAEDKPIESLQRLPDKSGEPPKALAPKGYETSHPDDRSGSLIGSRRDRPCPRCGAHIPIYPNRCEACGMSASGDLRVRCPYCGTTDRRKHAEGCKVGAMSELGRK